jgi:hypothetical protein
MPTHSTVPLKPLQRSFRPQEARFLISAKFEFLNTAAGAWFSGVYGDGNDIERPRTNPRKPDDKGLIGARRNNRQDGILEDSIESFGTINAGSCNKEPAFIVITMYEDLIDANGTI